MTRRKPITAAELMAQLEADPAWVAARARTNAEREAQAAELARAEAPLVAEVRAAGYAVDSAWDLVNTTVAYPIALPILLEHLSRPYPAAVREGIARALAVRDARFAWGALTSMYRAEQDVRVKDALAAAVAAVADKNLLDELIALAADPQHGPSRILLLHALRRSRDPRAGAALVSLAADPELREQIEIILRPRKRKHH